MSVMNHVFLYLSPVNLVCSYVVKLINIYLYFNVYSIYIPLTFTNVLKATLYAEHLAPTISSDLIARLTVAVARAMNN